MYLRTRLITGEEREFGTTFTDKKKHDGQEEMSRRFIQKNGGGDGGRTHNQNTHHQGYSPVPALSSSRPPDHLERESPARRRSHRNSSGAASEIPNAWSWNPACDSYSCGTGRRAPRTKTKNGLETWMGSPRRSRTATEPSIRSRRRIPIRRMNRKSWS